MVSCSSSFRRELVGCKWVYKTKFTIDGRIEKYKAILVAKGFNQLEGIDYNETFAPISKMNTIRTILSIVASYKWELHQMDVKSDFLMVILMNTFICNNLLVLFMLNHQV